ncbi:MAG: hypothetical protein EXQ56_10135 [Acidobacteria bacterium]|nr:hypothetical protein [Acidobacteriota bacterium]
MRIWCHLGRLMPAGAGFTLTIFLLSACALPLRAQYQIPEQWEQWFYGQRMYGLGYIPNDALVRAISQRDKAATGIRKAGMDGFSVSALSNATIGGGTSSLEDGSVPAITNGRWFEMGPSAINSSLDDTVSGRINSLAIDPRNPSTLYVAAAGGGVWKSVNRGGRWTPLTDNLPSLASGAVGVDPFTSEVWYGTGELNFCRDCYYGAGVYRSGDGGISWNRVNPEAFLTSPTSLIKFDSRRQGTIFIGRSTALWKTSDNGLTWRVVLRGAITDLAIHPLDSNIAYAAVGNFNGGPDNGIFRSTDGGETWTRLVNGLAESGSMGRISLTIAPSDPNILFALIVRATDYNLQGLFRSVNGGTNWSQIGNLPADLFSEDGQGQGLFNALVRTDPRTPGVVYVGGIKLWRSADFGATWEDVSTPARLHEDPRDIVFDPSDPATFYLIGDSGVWRTSDSGRSFLSVNQTLGAGLFQSVALHPTNPSLAVGGTQDNGTALYAGSMLWEQGRPGDSGAVFYDRENPQTIFTVARRHSLRRSVDGGKTFQLIAEGLDGSDRVQFYPPFLADPSQSSTLYFATQRIWRSTNRGDSWTPLSSDLTGGATATISALAVAPTDSRVLFAGTSNARVMVTLDNGANWRATAALPNRFVTSIAIEPVYPGRAVATLSGFGTGHVFRTENFGETWVDISANLPDIPVNAVMLDAVNPSTIYVGTDIGVFVRLEDGTWSAMRDGLPNVVVLGLAQNPATGLIAAATHGRGVFAISTNQPALSAPRSALLTNAASGEVAPATPGMISSLLGANMASTSAAVGNSLPLPTGMAGTTILVNDVPAPLFSVSPTRLDFQIPYGLTGPFTQITVRTNDGEATMRVARADTNPGIVGASTEAVTHGNGLRVSETAPARVGEELVLYSYGLGSVSPAVPAGQGAPSFPVARTTINPVVRVGNATSEVRSANLVPGSVGRYQINFMVPAGQTGLLSVRLDSGVQPTNTTFINVIP